MNKNELKAQMVRHGDSSQNLAKALGISQTSLSEKINGKREFTRSQIAVIKARYELSAEENDYIFFGQEVD